MSIITTGTQPKLLWPGLAAIWGNNYTEKPKEWSMIFDTENSDKAYEEDQQITQFGMAPIKSETSAVSYDTEAQGITPRYNNITYALGYIVSMENIQDNKYEVVASRRTTGLAFSVRQTEETVHANILNRGFSSSYLMTGGDGVEMFSTAHPTLSGNQSNHLTTAADLSEAALEDLGIQIMNNKNNRGLRIAIKPQCLIVPPNLWFEANRIVKSILQNDSANNAINVIHSTNMFPKGIIVNHYLSDTDAWFIKTDAPRGLMHFSR